MPIYKFYLVVEVARKKLPSWIQEAHKGYLRLLILTLLSKKPMHGYEIMNEVEARTLGLWRPTAGGIYPLLKRMEERGEVRSEWKEVSGRRRKVYWIMPNGRSKLHRALEKQKILLDTLDSLHKDFLEEILEVKLPREHEPLPILQGILHIGGLKHKTAREKRKLLLTLKGRIEKAIDTMRILLEEINEKLA